MGRYDPRALPQASSRSDPSDAKGGGQRTRAGRGRPATRMSRVRSDGSTVRTVLSGPSVEVGSQCRGGVQVFGDFSASEQRLGQWQQRIEQRAQRYEQARERVERIRVTETSRDGAIAVTVGSNGLLIDLRVSDRTPLRPSGIGAEVLGCLRRAQAKLPELVGEAMAETVGEDTASAQELLGTLRKSFPEAQSLQPPPRRGPQPPQRPRRDEDDDDWSNRSFLQ